MEPDVEARQLIYEEILKDLTNIEYDAPGTGKIFGTTSKYFFDVPQQTPALFLADISTDPPDRTNLNFDDLTYVFSAYTYVYLEGQTQTELDDATDKLRTIEGYLYKYVGKIPNRLGTINNTRVYDIDFRGANYTEVVTPGGRALQLSFQFGVSVNFNVHLIKQ